MADIKKISESILSELQENLCENKAAGKIKNFDEVLLNLYFLDALEIEAISELKTNILLAIDLYLWQLGQLKKPINYLTSTPLKKGIEVLDSLRYFYQKSVIDLSEYPSETLINDIMFESKETPNVKILLLSEEDEFTKKGIIDNINKLSNALERDLKTLLRKTTLSEINRSFDDRVFDLILEQTKNKISKTQLLKDIQALRISIKKNFIF